MQTAKECFAQMMQNPVQRDWYLGEPERIKEMVQLYPFTVYKMSDNTPDGLLPPGQIVHIRAYCETGYVVVAVYAQQFLPLTCEKIMAALCEKHKADPNILNENFQVRVDPKYLDPII